MASGDKMIMICVCVFIVSVTLGICSYKYFDDKYDIAMANSGLVQKIYQRDGYSPIKIWVKHDGSQDIIQVNQENQVNQEQKQ